MGVLLFIVLVALLLVALVSAGGYSVRRYWSPVGSETVETEGMTSGTGGAIVAAILALMVLILLFFGFAQWNWFGTGSQTGPPSTTTVASPVSAPSGGTKSSPAASPSVSPAPTPS